MIRLTRLNGSPIMVNAEAIESLESTPDTLISFASGQKLAVKESVDEVRDRFIAYQREVRGGPQPALTPEATCLAHASPPDDEN